MVARIKYLAVIAAVSLCAQTIGSAEAAGTPAQKCASSKMKSSGKRWSADAKCWATAISKGVAVDAACLSKATDKLTAAFGKAEAKGGCSTNGDAGTIGGKIVVVVDDVSSDLAGGEKCGGAKMKAAGKAWGAKAKCYSKALAASTNVDAACISKAQGKYDDAFTKLDGSGDCTVTADGPAISTKIDDNVEDIVGDLGCGNGNLEGDEECDDGNLVSGDDCSSLCEIEPPCGNGDLDSGETCDDGGESVGCDTDCTAASCGDGTLNVTASEGCDDGNLDETDGCTTSCVVGAPCTAAAYPTLPYPVTPTTKFTVSAASGHCYVGASQSGDWFDHADECSVAGGTLAVPNTGIENTFISSARAGSSYISIGIHDLVVEGTFVSLTGESFTTNWAGGEPNNVGDEDCVVMYANTLWADFPCAAFRDEFVCEFAP